MNPILSHLLCLCLGILLGAGGLLGYFLWAMVEQWSPPESEYEE